VPENSNPLSPNCRGCGEGGALLDGHFCSHCLGYANRKVRFGLEDSPIPFEEVHQAFVNEAGRLQIEVELRDY